VESLATHPMASDLAARRRRVRTKKGLHPTMKAFYFVA
jgi:hypothetical protein